MGLPLWTVWTILAVLVTGGQGITDGTHPGLKLRVSQPGLDYAAKVAIDVLSSKVSGQAIPDQRGTSRVKVGKVDWEMTQMRVTSFAKPSTNVTVDAGFGIHWSIAGAGLSIRGRWHYKYRWHFVKVSDGGSFDVSVSGITMSVAVTLARDPKTNRFLIKSNSCTAVVGRVKVKFHGGASWLYQIFAGTVEKALKKQLHSVLCKQAQEAINVNAAKQLGKMKLFVKIGKSFDLDYGLVANPKFAKGYMETYHKGEIFLHGNHTQAPFAPRPLPSDPEVTRMVTLWLSAYTMDTLGYVAHSSGMLRKTLTAKDLPPKSRGYLNTTCQFGKCIGSLLRAVAKKYPNCLVSLVMRSTQPPSLSSTAAAGVGGRFAGTIAFSATPIGKPGPGVEFMTLAMSLNVTLNVTIQADGDKLTAAKLTQFNLLDLKLVTSTVGPLPMKNLKTIMQFALDKYVVPQLNTLGVRGLPIPTLGDVGLVQPQLKLEDGAVRIATNLQYKPTILYWIEGQLVEL